MENAKSKRVIMNINWRLPRHIIQVIFSKLSIVNLPACRLVCKCWNDLILNQASTCPNTFFLCTVGLSKMQCVEFDPKHLGLGGMSFVASFAFQEGDWSTNGILDSCNGLLFIFKYGPSTRWAGILNPITNEYIRLPGGNNSYEDDETFYVRTNETYDYGFGFSPKTKRYKVARVSFDMKKSSSIFDIFTFGSNQWRSCVDSVPFVIHHNGVYFNGALYWIGINKKNGYEYVICRFDVENEKIETTISLSGVGPSREVSIQAFNGSVYVTFFFMYPCYKIQVWRMQSYGRKDSWITEFVINDMPKDWVLRLRLTVYLKLIKAFEDGEILCLVNHKSFILYSPKTGSIKTLNPLEHQRKFLCVSQVDSFHFGSLHKILAGNDG